MKYILLFIFVIMGFSASAQWYRVDLKFKKQPPRPSQITTPVNNSIARLPNATFNTKAKIHVVEIERSQYSIEAAEASVIKTAQHNMRFRIYNDASYNFSELAHLYVLQNRFSEAKWYLLQSNNISRRQNDDKHTVTNLIDLAMVKANMGDYNQAEQDLAEAEDIARIRVLNDELAEIASKKLYLKQNKLSPPRPELRYADAEMVVGKKK